MKREYTCRKIMKLNKFLINKIKNCNVQKRKVIKLKKERIFDKIHKKSTEIEEYKKNNNSNNNIKEKNDTKENNLRKGKKVKGSLKRNVSQADIFNSE